MDPDGSHEEQYRSGAYGYLAALLRAEPGAGLLSGVAALSEVDGRNGEMEAAMAMLGLAAGSCSVEAVQDEYFNLFIGLGRGELVPYGSWYQTGFLMEKPLGELREDLRGLGFERDESVSEPEDHVAALFEVMAMLVREGASAKRQAEFFERHLGNWVGGFFEDLAAAKSATFYKAVARFGASFMEFEKRYLGMRA